MTTPDGRDHLVERAARRLQSVSPGLSGLLSDQDQVAPARTEPGPEALRAPSRPVRGPPPAEPQPAPSATEAPSGPADVEPPSDHAAPAPQPAIEPAMLRQVGLAPDDPGRSRVMEEFRLIQGRVLRAVQANFEAGAKGANMVLITSAKPGEGKTFSSLHLADAIARHGGRRTLLVDLDVRQNTLTRLLGLQDRPGLLAIPRSTDFTPADLIVDTCVENLSVLPAGKLPNDDHSRNDTAALAQALETLSRSCADRILILDGPPCLSTSDPSLLAAAIAQTILVVQAEATQRSELEASLELLQACPTVLLMLNKVKFYQNYTFGAYVDYKARATS